LRIAIIGTRGIPANYGGFETCVDEVARRLAADGEDVTVYCRRNNVGDAGTEYAGVKLRSLPSVYRKSLDTISHTFLSVVDALPRGFPLFHVYGVGNAVFVPLLRLFRRRVVISVDGLEWKRRKWGRFARAWLRLSEYFAVRFADEIVADSKVVQAYYRERHGRETAYIPYGAYTTRRDTTGHVEAAGLKPDGYVLFVGRLIPEKGVHHLIRAFAGVRTDMPLVIVGDDPYNPEYVASLRRMADERVLFLGYVYGDAYEELCSHARVYVQPSELEGTSPALLAAMGFGNCVVVNGIPENLETIGDAGLSYPVNDIEALREILQRLADDPGEVETYRGRAVERIRKVYNWDRIASDCRRLYRRVLGGEWADGE
jgi:glycosyltransferase involved in cell wall biosynthesis